VSGGGKSRRPRPRIDGASAVVLPPGRSRILDCAPCDQARRDCVRAARPADDVAGVVDVHRFALEVACSMPRSLMPVDGVHRKARVAGDSRSAYDVPGSLIASARLCVLPGACRVLNRTVACPENAADAAGPSSSRRPAMAVMPNAWLLLSRAEGRDADAPLCASSGTLRPSRPVRRADDFAKIVDAVRRAVVRAERPRSSRDGCCSGRTRGARSLRARRPTIHRHC